MRRFFDQQLSAWKTNPRRKPLLVRGARQVGKTTTIESFGRDNFDELVTVDLERNRRLHPVFDGDLSAHRVLKQLRSLLGVSLRPGKSLLFIDEIQACPDAVRALRYLREDQPDLHVVAAGSLLDFAFDHIPVPVGRMQFAELGPMTFVEFLWALGHDSLGDELLAVPRDLGVAMHERLLELLDDFAYVGGMPEAVSAFVDYSARESFRVLQELATSYQLDFAKYAPRSDSRCLEDVFATVALQVGQQTIYTKLSAGFSGPTIRKAHDLLTKARIITKVPAALPGLPLGETRSRRFKTLIIDTGLCQALRGSRYEDRVAGLDLLHLHRGAIAEQIVGQELLAAQRQLSGQQAKLHYWARQARGSSAEVDYLVAVDGTVLPIEVKSGAAGRLRSMHLLLEQHQEIPYGLVLSTARYNVLPAQRLCFTPIYFALSAALSAEARTPLEA